MRTEILNTITLSREEFDRIEIKPDNYQFWVLDRIAKGDGYVYTYSLYKGDIPVGIGDVVSALPDSMRAQKGGFRASAFCLSAEKPDKPSEAAFADYQTLVNSTVDWKSRPSGEAERGMYWWVSYHWFVGDGEVLDGGDEWTDPIRATGIEGVGVKGDRGAKGDQGDRGDQGIQGKPGKDGKNGKDVVAFFHSGVEKPEAPTSNEPTNGWQRVCAADSRWMCVGTGENGTSLTWGEPVQVKGTILNYNDENGYIEDEFGNLLGLAFSPVYWIDAESVVVLDYNGRYTLQRELVYDENGNLLFTDDGLPMTRNATLELACYISTPKGTRRKIGTEDGYKLHCKVRDIRIQGAQDYNEFTLEYKNGAWLLPLEDWYNKDRKTNFIELHLMRYGESQPLAIKFIEAVKDGRIVKFSEVKAHKLPYTANPTVTPYGTDFDVKLDFGIPQGEPGTSVFAVSQNGEILNISDINGGSPDIIGLHDAGYKYCIYKSYVRELDSLVEIPRRGDIVVGAVPLSESNGVKEYWSFKCGPIGEYLIGLTKIARITGEQGIQGVQGDTYTPVVGSVETLAPNIPATVQAVSDPDTLTTRFNFGIPKGEQGVQGIQGVQGVQGVQGERGLQGVQGEKGEQGERGVQGERGEKGEKGDAFEIKQVYTSVQDMNDRMAEDALPIGSFVLINTGNVEDPDNAKLYVKAQDGYRYLTDMSGAQGIQGERGPQGIQGERGEQGLRGEQGIQGIQGERGPQGVQGEQGLPGVNGTNGTNGITYTPVIKTVTTLAAGSEATALGVIEGSKFNIHLGLPRGVQGVQGIQGERGLQGVQGPKGDTGAQGIQGPKGDTGAQGPQGNNGNGLPDGLVVLAAGIFIRSPWEGSAWMSKSFVGNIVINNVTTNTLLQGTGAMCDITFSYNTGNVSYSMIIHSGYSATTTLKLNDGKWKLSVNKTVSGNIPVQVSILVVGVK